MVAQYYSNIGSMVHVNLPVASIPANRTRWLNVVVMLGQRRRRFVFSGYSEQCLTMFNHWVENIISKQPVDWTFSILVLPPYSQFILYLK